MVLALIALFGSELSARHDRMAAEFIPAPMLFTPGETVVLTAGQPVEFRWSGGFYGSSEWEYDLRVYKGKQNVSSALLVRQRLPSRVTSFSMKPEQFEAGQIYSWSLRIVGPSKGRAAYSLFKTVKS